MNTHLPKPIASIVLSLLIIIPLFCQAQLKPYGKDIIADAQKLIKKYHAGVPKAKNVVKVVYFHGKDREPLANWEERLDRTLTAVNDLYVSDFKNLGIKTDGVNFERSGKKYQITVIRGDYNSQQYDPNSGAQLMTEIHKKAAGKIDFANDHVLVLTGLTYRRPDGVYVFHSPYNGTGSSERGVCYAADSEMLDPKYLTDKSTRMQFSEMAANFKDCLVAEFNSWYIGGIAHEMGHMFGLHHDLGNPAELTPSTISLMGEYGSRHYESRLWGDQQTSHLSAAGVLQLLSHPVFTGSRKEINTHDPVAMTGELFAMTDSSIVPSANLSGTTSPYALTVLIHHTNSNEYLNESTIYPIRSLAPLNIKLRRRPVGNYRIAFLFMFPNGTVQGFYKIFRVNDNSAELLNLPDAGTIDPKEYYSRLSKKEQTADIKYKLELLEKINNPAPPEDASNYNGKSLYLSDAKWEVANVGWEKPARNFYSTESEALFFLENQGQLFEKGLMAHSPSRYTFRLNSRWERFTAVVGLRDYAHQQGSARFTVIGDGKVLYTSPDLRVGQRANVDIKIQNVNVLELKAEGTEGHNYNSWASWFDPLISR